MTGNELAKDFQAIREAENSACAEIVDGLVRLTQSATTQEFLERAAVAIRKRRELAYRAEPRNPPHWQDERERDE